MISPYSRYNFIHFNCSVKLNHFVELTCGKQHCAIELYAGCGLIALIFRNYLQAQLVMSFQEDIKEIRPIELVVMPGFSKILEYFRRSWLQEPNYIRSKMYIQVISAIVANTLCITSIQKNTLDITLEYFHFCASSEFLSWCYLQVGLSWVNALTFLILSNSSSSMSSFSEKMLPSYRNYCINWLPIVW